jgi:uncharacterized membrane protein
MSASEAVPSSREFTLVGIAYGAFVMGLFLVWPSVIGVVIAYVRRSDVAGGILESHYRWLIRTFWWSLAIGVVVIAGMVSVIVPNALELSEAARSGDYLSIPWSLIGAALGGGLALSLVWLWTGYRLMRGLLRLADGRAAP